MCFFNDTATTEIYSLSLHDALPISYHAAQRVEDVVVLERGRIGDPTTASFGRTRSFRSDYLDPHYSRLAHEALDRKSTRLNSSHANISYAVFCLKKNNLRIELATP